MSDASVKAWADLEYVRTWPMGIVAALAVAAVNLFLLRIASEHFFVSDLWAGAVPFLFWFWFGWSVRRDATEQARLMTSRGYVFRRGAWVRP